ncbi:hypothetical protein [Bradyrhizobium japonicum]|uniref:hypothetical protein n=1 Tax=Bradyrhizobium japonicum TaxID=375 RepID=UPI002714CACF|nr:hypothetical protein [Bradyrhizobium japonicum]WLB15020.1 hypothetical protein QIH95_23400 [Bradyrhizobium japonicum]
MTDTHLDQKLSFVHSASPSALASSKNVGLQPQMEPCSRMVNAAASRIYAAWQPHLGHDDALREARAFAGRFHVLIDGPLAPLPDETGLDATLAAVAFATAILASAQ